MVSGLLAHRERVKPARRITVTSVNSGSQESHDKCRACGGAVFPFVDLGLSPLCDTLLTPAQLELPEIFYPLNVKICASCWLAQHREYVSAHQIFPQYANVSSVSDSRLAHARSYVEAVIREFGLGTGHLVVEIGSNDGYLLRFVMQCGIPCLGIEPALIAAERAEHLGIPTVREFFTQALALKLVSEGRLADLIVANDVLSEVSDLNDFAAGLAALLKPDGVTTIEVPHLMRLIERNQFDAIYHENLWYFSLGSVENLLAGHGLRIFDVEEVATQGGSLRLFCCAASSARAEDPFVSALRKAEVDAGLRELATYRKFEAKVVETKHKLLEMLLTLKRQGDRIVGYGAPGKGSMLLNYCGIRGDILDFTVDRNPYKQRHYLPGTHIPVESVEHLDAVQPPWILILPWNFEHEIVAQLGRLRANGTKFIVPIPEPRIVA